MKKIGSTLLTILLSLTFLPTKIEAKIELLDRIAAIVDSSVIMESELNSRLDEIITRLKENNTELPPQEILEEQVLDRLIIEEIQLQIGEKAGVKISDAELNKALSVMASQNLSNLEDFKKNLELEGISYKHLRNRARKEMIIQRVQRGKVSPKIEISEQEIDNFLNSEEGKNKLAEQYNVQQILLPIKINATQVEKEEIENKGKSIIEKLSNGESFSKLAATFSSGQNALEGGSIGWRKASELPSLFAEEVVNMEVGDFSKLIRSGAGLHIIFLTEKRGDTVKYEDQTHIRHILVKSSEIRTENQTEKLINDIYAKLIEGEGFKELARQFSEDPGSKMEGGELGWATEGAFDPMFEKVMIETEINEISEPFKSSFGWHVLEVLGRRNEDISETVRKNRAYQIIFTRKFEQELQRTLIELRSEAYVDIKLNK